MVARANHGKCSKSSISSLLFTSIHKACGVSANTSARAEARAPRADDRGMIYLHDLLHFGEVARTKPRVACEGQNRFEPELRLAIGAGYMHVHSQFFTR